MREELPALVHVVDDDADLGAAIVRLLIRNGYQAQSFLSPETMLDANARQECQCVVTDVMMGEVDGFALAEALRIQNPAVAIIFMTAWPTTANAVDAVRRYGGLDYLEKPIDEARLLAAIAEGSAWSRRRGAALRRIEPLTAREREVLELLAAGMSNKQVAASLNLSTRTVEDHRATVMAKTGASGVADLVALFADAK
ncbi:DNA-binding response regulator [Aurantiacibacter xanthus]|uniref:DNA-binding response regulator n=1 Tax=Aurantiacibacter xanthus TaxID=1784712 RepID=A0A3A1PH97_9SPHN|nr:response regulator [Aurantiacibacter xanthus]RIV92335.1 DNA-binding response regulator [Aurantiacibacter xanthus]